MFAPIRNVQDLAEDVSDNDDNLCAGDVAYSIRSALKVQSPYSHTGTYFFHVFSRG